MRTDSLSLAFIPIAFHHTNVAKSYRNFFRENITTIPDL